MLIGTCPKAQILPPERIVCSKYDKKRNEMKPPLLVGDPPTHHLKPPLKEPCWPYNERMVKGPGVDTYGMIARVKGTDWKWRSMLADQRVKGDKKQYFDRKPKNSEDDTGRVEFLKKTDNKIFTKRVDLLVEAEIKKYDDHLEDRRDKLRDLLIDEEKRYIEMYVDRSQRANDSHFEDMKREVKKLKEETEIKRQELVENKRLQQYASSFDEYRKQFEKRNRLITREVQVYQIHEHKQLEANRKHIERMWTELELKQMEEKRLEEEKCERERKDREIKMRKILDEQIREKDEKQIKKIRDDREAAEEFRKALKEQKQEEIKAELEERNKHAARREELNKQLQEHRAIVKKRQNDEYQLELMFAKLSTAAMEKEKSAITDVSEQHKRETQQHLENLKRLRREKEKDEIEMNRLIDEVRLDQERKTNEKREARRERIQNNLQENNRCLLEQIKNRKEQQEAEMKRILEEQECESKQADQQMLALEEQQRQFELSRRDYAQDLLDQMEYNKLIKAKEREEVERTLQAQVLEEKRYHDKIRELLHFQIKKEEHPFRKVIHGLAVPVPPL